MYPILSMLRLVLGLACIASTLLPGGGKLAC